MHCTRRLQPYELAVKIGDNMWPPDMDLGSRIKRWPLARFSLRNHVFSDLQAVNQECLMITSLLLGKDRSSKYRVRFSAQ